jgi:hypothetical protein
MKKKKKKKIMKMNKFLLIDKKELENYKKNLKPLKMKKKKKQSHY